MWLHAMENFENGMTSTETAIATTRDPLDQIPLHDDALGQRRCVQLGHPELLERCLKRKAQDPESLHSVV